MSGRWRYLALGLAGVLLLTAAAVLLLARSEKGHRLVVDGSISALEEALGARVSVEETSGTLLGSLVWKEVRIRRPDLELTVDRLSFRIDYLALAGKQVRITGLKAEGPSLELKQPLVEPPPRAVAESDLDPEKEKPAPAPPSPLPTPETKGEKPKGGGWKISLAGAELKRGRIQGLALALGRPELGPVEGIEGRADLTFQNDLLVKARVKARTELNRRPVKVELTAGYDGRGAEAERLILFFGPKERNRLELAGSVDLETLRSDLTYRTELEPADLQAQLGPLLPPGSNLDLLEGRVSLKGGIKGNPDKFSLEAEGGWGEARVEVSATLARAGMELTAQGRIRNLDPARLSKFSGTTLPKGRGGLSFTVRGNLPHRLTGELNLEETELGGLGRIRGGWAQVGLDQGRLKGQLRLLGPAGFKAAAEVIEVRGEYGPEGAEVRVGFKNLKGYKALVERGGFNLTYRNQRLSLTDLRLREGSGSLTGQARASLEEGGLTSAQARLELSELTPPAGLLKDLLGLEAPLAELASIRLTGPVEASFPGRELILTLPGMRLDSRWGKIEGPGSIRLSKLGEIQEYTLDLDVSRFTVPGWAWPFLPPELQECLINGRLKLRGDQKTIVFEAVLSSSGLAGQEIEELNLKGRLALPETLVLERLRLGLLGTSLTASGPAWPEPALKIDLKGAEPNRLLTFLTKLNLIPALPPFKLAAYGIKGTLAGTPDLPSFKGRLRAKGAAWREYSLQELNLGLDLKKVDLADLAGTKGKAGLRLARLRGPDLPPFDLDLDLTSTKAGDSFTGRLKLAGARSLVESGLVVRPAGGTGLT